MTEKEFLTGVLSKTLNFDENGVASLFNEDGTIKEDALQTVTESHAKHVSELKTGSTKTAFDDGYKKAQSEVLSKFENDFKTKTGHKSDKKGIDLVLDYANSVQKEGEITEDLLKKHPKVLTWLEEKDAAIAAAKAEGETALNTFKTEISKKEAFSTVAQKALELFHKEKPILSKDPIKAKRQEELFIKELKAFDYELQEGRIVVLKDGKVYENANGHSIKFDELVKNTASSYFDFHTVDAKSSPGNQNPQQGAKTFNFEVPKTAEEYAKAVSDPSKSLEERQAIDKAYTESKTA
jgi:hypothetical protein